MIERMKKISFLLHARDRNSFLKELQKLGMIHINTAKDLKKLEILVLEEKLSKLCSTKEWLLQIASSHKETSSQENPEKDPDQLLAEINKIKSEIDDFKLQLEKWEKDKKIAQPWGNVEQEKMEALRKAGLVIRHLIISSKDWARIDSSKMTFEVVNKGKKLHIVLVQKIDELVTELPGQNIAFPSFGLVQINEKIYEIECEIANRVKMLLTFTRYIEIIDRAIEEYQDRLSHIRVNNSFSEQVSGHVLALTGWFPVKNEIAIRQFFEKQMSVFLIEKPQYEDAPPVKITNRGLTKLFEPIMRIFDIPAYNGIDTTFFLAPFFAIFFGMCMADVGYGLILLIATLIAFSRVKPQWRTLVKLSIVLSVMTILGGILIGDIFGIHFLPNEYSFFYGFQSKEELLGTSWNPDEHKMAFSMMLGVLQITLAYILRAFVGFRQYGWQGGLKGIGLLLIIDGLIIWGVMQGVGISFTIGPWKIGEGLFAIPYLSDIAFCAIFVGLFLLFFFNSVEHRLKFWLRPLVGLWELFEFLSSVPGYILSYLRLFAIGLAGGLLGLSFNNIAMIVLGGEPTILTWLAMGLILLLGHTINLSLALIASFVHPIRLTFVEFYNCLGFKGGGLEYKPFCCSRENYHSRS